MVVPFPEMAETRGTYTGGWLTSFILSVFNLQLAVDVDMLSRWLDMSGLALEL